MSLSPRTEFTVDRAVPLLAAVMITVSIVLVAVFGPWWLILTGFVAANLAFYAFAGWCPASLLLVKLGLPRQAACAVPAEHAADRRDSLPDPRT